jgi:hypothetical protein
LPIRRIRISELSGSLGLSAIAESAQKVAKQEKLRADQEKLRADTLASHLRFFGINPEAIY